MRDRITVFHNLPPKTESSVRKSVEFDTTSLADRQLAASTLLQVGGGGGGGGGGVCDAKIVYLFTEAPCAFILQLQITTTLNG